MAGTPRRFRMHADAKQVRVRYPEGVSTVADANLTLQGAIDRSSLSGTITILRTGFNPQSDFSSILASGSAAPLETPSAKPGLLSGMKFDVADRDRSRDSVSELADAGSAGGRQPAPARHCRQSRPCWAGSTSRRGSWSSSEPSSPSTRDRSPSSTRSRSSRSWISIWKPGRAASISRSPSRVR